MKKGFTLIELLAVIIILAIVALIATPIVLDVVNDAKDSAAKSEASMIVSGVNNYCASADMREQLTGDTNICENGVTPEEVNTMVDLGNAKVEEIEFTNSKVSKLVVSSNGRTIKYDGSTYIIGGEVADTPEEPQVTAYYAFGKPTTSSSTNYQDVITESGSNAFVKLEGEQLSVCIYRNNTLECFKNSNYAEENVHVQNVFGADSCEPNGYGIGCYVGDFYCDVFPIGYVYCHDIANGHDCSIDADGYADCY